MKTTTYSDGIEKYNGKNYQVSNIRVIMTTVGCPYCSHDHDDPDSSELIITCESCGKEFMIGTINY